MTAQDGTGDGDEALLLGMLARLRVLPDIARVEQAVLQARRRRPRASPDELSRAAVRGTVARVTGIGALTALPGAVPGIGTAVEIAVAGATFTGETWSLIRALTTLQLTVAGLHGLDLREPARRDELLIVLGLEAGIIVPASEAAARVGTLVAVSRFNSHANGELVTRVNRRLGASVAARWGARRGGVALGQLIPFGVGTVVGGGMNLLTARGFGSATLRLYEDLLPGDRGIVVLDARG